MISWLEQGSTTKDTGARLNSACRSRAHRPLEHDSTGMIREELNKRLVGVRLNQPRTLEQGPTVSTGARLKGSWSKAQQG